MKLHAIGRIYAVKFTDGTMRIDGHDADGVCIPEKRLIIISSTAHDKTQTLLHELAHAVIGESGLRRAVNWSDDVEEIMCETFARAILDNRTVIRKLLAKR